MKAIRKTKKTIITGVITYTIVGLSFVLALVGVLLRFSGKSFYIFGSRFDVVLTNSMSEKNPIWADFLEGHDDQIQAFDLVVSKEVKSQDDLALYDIVLFDNPHIGTDMHRIVGVIEDSNSEIQIKKSEFGSIDDYSGISMPNTTSGITSNAISVNEITLVTFSLNDYADSHFNFNVANTDYKPTIITENVDGGFLKTYTIIRDDTTSPGRLTISHKYKYDYSSELLLSCSIIGGEKDKEIIVNNQTLKVEGDNLVGTFNPVYVYEIRGDAAPNSDGVYGTDKIYSKVVNVIPKMGYVVRFLSSVWGLVLFIGLGFIAVSFDIVMGHLEKKDSSSTKDNSGV